MENSESNPQAWTFFADNDLLAAETLVDNAELSGETVFHCQQAVEKYLKAFLAKSNISFKKTHDLAELYSKIKEIKDWNIDEVKLEELSDLYVESRYPSKVNFLQTALFLRRKIQKYFWNLHRAWRKLLRRKFK